MAASDEELAARLLTTAIRDEQAAHRISDTDDVEAVRAEVRRLARAAGLHIRTGIVDGTLVVVREDAAVWNEDTATMREKLAPGPED